nr:hypothetical protein [uncultured Dyadobacter sp.]
MRILVTLHDDGNSRLTELLPELQNAGFDPLVYQDEDQILGMIAQTGENIEILDFICHGSQTTFGDTDLSTVDQFGQSLSQISCIGSDTLIYLDGCNTGLRSGDDGPIAQDLANACGCTVFGSQGYITTGAIALGDVECFDSVGSWPPVPGSRHLYGDDVWIEFNPSHSFRKSKRIRKSFIVQVGFKHERKQNSYERTIKKILRQTMSKTPLMILEVRIAPDIIVELFDRGITKNIEVLANGRVIRDRLKDDSWLVSTSRAKKLLKSVNKLRR